MTPFSCGGYWIEARSGEQEQDQEREGGKDKDSHRYNESFFAPAPPRRSRHPRHEPNSW